jgi:hypothetical protein
MKTRTNISVDHDVLQKAKDKMINVSGVAEKAIRDKLDVKDVEIDMIERNCQFCGMIKENMIWLWPDERWICNACLKYKAGNIIK